ncbi:UNVERIFIED_CONTAM: WEB family protein, chloroplastic [Sesamum angustifolium]|uniref:WEB family protein, chloroplastic n=1 Tax=Sesamum angustifolium TaxID=2727405 RepID=A0AAW2LEU7_9LAMI
MVLKATNEKYESMLDNAKQEINALSHSIEQSKDDYQNLKVELEQKELHLTTSLEKAEEENSSMGNEINRLFTLLKRAEEEARGLREGGDHWKKSFKEAESELIYLKEDLSEVKTESMRLKEGLMERENEWQNILLENEELRKKDSERKEIFSKARLEEAKKHGEENGEATDSEKDYDMLPKVVEFSEQNGTGEVKPKVALESQSRELPVKEEAVVEVSDVCSNESVHRAPEVENPNERVKDGEANEKGNADAAEADSKMWGSCKIDEKDLLLGEQQSFEDEVESGGDAYEQANGVASTENVENGGSSPTKSENQRKKKPLLRKFGSLLKKKGSSSSSNQK